MAVTFTNKAADEMKERLEDLVGEEALGQLTVGTFHSICARILRREGGGGGFDGRFVIFDTTDQQRLLKRVLDDLQIDAKRWRPAAVLAEISRAKNQMLLPEAYEPAGYWEEVVGRIYERYHQILRASNGLDFDDLLMETVFLLRDDASTLDRYRKKYRHVVVDEFQDTNLTQYELLKLLAAADADRAPHNLFAVGDEDQSIYGWRGADYRNVASFRSDFPGCRVFLLERNYRSTQTILDAAGGVINRNPNRTPKTLWTDSGPGDPISRHDAFDEAGEAAYVAREIEEHVQEGGSYGDIAVMYRTNAQSRVLEESLVLEQIPYQLVRATRFYERREVRDVLGYLRVLHNPRDEVSLERIINVPPRGVGPKGWATVQTVARECGVGSSEAVRTIVEDRRSPGEHPTCAVDTRTRNALSAYHELMTELTAIASDTDLTGVIDFLLEAIGFEEWLEKGFEKADERWENVLQLRSVAAEYDGIPWREGLAEMLESVALVSDVDQLDSNWQGGVKLLTLHAAKGLEFPVVFLTGLEEGLLPHASALGDDSELEEERRLFYVGLTRARQKVHLTAAAQRARYYEREYTDISRFIEDIPDSLVVQPGVEPAEVTPDFEDEVHPDYDYPDDVDLSPGTRVRHPHFGPGKIIDVVGSGEAMKVTVLFDDGSRRTIVVKYGQLEVG
jgi:DNA helicase-2/ATP-dependent DNA helicase PcrA